MTMYRFLDQSFAAKAICGLAALIPIERMINRQPEIGFRLERAVIKITAMTKEADE